MFGTLFFYRKEDPKSLFETCAYRRSLTSFCFDLKTGAGIEYPGGISDFWIFFRFLGNLL